MSEALKIFVTGGTGFIGKHFIEKLKSMSGQDATIYVLARKNVDFDDSRIVKLKGDLLEIEKYRDLILSCDYIFHLAANVNFFGSTSEDEKVNFESSKKFVDILKSGQNNLKDFIFVSTIGAVDRHKDDDLSKPLDLESKPSPTTLYGKSKLKSEEYIKQSGLPFTIIRPTWVYGKNMRENSHINKFVSMVYGQIPIHHLDFPGKVSLVYVGDLVSSFCSCIDNQKIIGKTYFAATEGRSIGELFSIISNEINGKKPFQINIPGFFSAFVRKVHNRLPLTVANLFVDYLFADGGRFTNDFNITKPVFFSEGVREVVDSNSSLFKQVRKYNKIGFGFFGAWLKHSLYPMKFFKQIFPDSGIVLDFGCGEGMLTNYLAQTLPGIKIIGIDRDCPRVDKARKAASKNAEFNCLSIENVKIDGAKAVLINDVLHHHSNENQKEILKKAISCLVEDGKLVLKEVDAGDKGDVYWTTFWDRKLYPNDSLNFHAPTGWDEILASLGWVRVSQYRVKHFWPASRTILVYSKKT